MRRKPSPGSRRSRQPSRRHLRLIERSPRVYLGPAALTALEEGRGVLLGSQRPGWVDALAFQQCSAGGWKELVERRFCQGGGLDPVGIVLSRTDLRRVKQELARELVPGDVVIALPESTGKPEAYVNLGDMLASATLKISRAGD